MILKYNMSIGAIRRGYNSIKLKDVAFYSLFLIINFNVNACNYPEIPSCQLEGELWIRSGILSFYQWDLLEPYYKSKISVPSNELYYLKDIFPEFNCFLPNKKDLSKFEPWRKKEVTAFFEEYPELLPLKAILTFNKTKHISNIAINTSVRNNFQKTKSNLQTKFYPNKTFKFNSTISYNDSIIRWKYRSLQLNTKNKTFYTLGNFSNKFDSGLLLGYTPKSNKYNNLPLNNWLYSSSNNWNGLKITKPLKKNSLSIVLHKNESEAIGAIKYRIKKESCSFSSLFSAIQTEEQDISYANSLNIKIDINKFRMSLNTLINSSNPQIIPIQFDFKYSLKAINQSIDFIYLPKGYYSTQSSIYRYFTYKLNQNPTKESEAFQISHYLSFKHNKKLYHDYGSTLVKSSKKYYLKQNIAFKFISKISPSLKIKLEKFPTLSKATINFSTPTNIKKNINLIPSYYFYINSYNYYRNSWRLIINCKLKNNNIQPGINYSFNCNNKKTLHIFSNFNVNLSNKCKGNYKLIYHPLESEDNKFEIYLGQTFKI